MAALAYYESGAVFEANGAMLAQLTSITVSDKGNLNPVYTTLLGLAGIAGGPVEAEMMVESALPKVGAEFAWANALNSRSVLTIQLKSEGVTETYTMICGEMQRTFKPDAAATKNLTLIGKRLGATT